MKPRRPLLLAALLLLGPALAVGLAACSEPASPEAVPAMPTSPSEPSASSPTPLPGTTRALATFGGGCFWCTEAVFRELEGVLDVTSGYAGGRVADPTYEQVCSGLSGHAEVVQVAYDPARLAYEDLLEVFFQTHDPTTPDRQGADVGPQYRSIVLWHDDAQREAAETVRADLDAAGLFERPIVTEIAPYTGFYPAERYHQDYFANNPNQGYCQVVIRPKLEKFRKRFSDRLREDDRAVR